MLIFPLPIIVLLQLNQLSSLYSVAQKIYKYQGLCLPKKELFKIKKESTYVQNEWHWAKYIQQHIWTDYQVPIGFLYE